jgi:hypothetical protein
LLAVGLASAQAGAAERPAPVAPGSESLSVATASKDVRAVADWIVVSGDNRGLAYVIVDKLNAKVLVFDGHGRLQGATSALLGLGVGDDTVSGIGRRRLATISPEERTTPAGRFVASLGHDFEQDVLWIDYDAAVSLHRVIVGRPQERRSQRLGSASTLDNRISYGCINVPAAFYDRMIVPAFRGTVGIVYILPETKPVEQVFAMSEIRRAPKTESAAEGFPHLDDSRARLPR